jgi:hypothetical protein
VILSHRDLGAVVQLEAQPLGYALAERRCAAHRDSPIVPKPEYGDGLPACGEFGNGCLGSGQRIEDPRPRRDAPTPGDHGPAVPVAGWRYLVG